MVDIDKPDLDSFPNFLESDPNFIDTLEAGEILFIPHGWFHHVVSISDCISLTWNFVHTSTWPDFFNYLIQNTANQELEIIQWFSRLLSAKEARNERGG